jgi:uncharacterized phage infection (PIP) family protein YhgE
MSTDNRRWGKTNDNKLAKKSYTVQSDITVIIDVTEAVQALQTVQASHAPQASPTPTPTPTPTPQASSNDRITSGKKVREQLSADIDTSIAQLQRIVQLMNQSCPGGAHGTDPYHYGDAVGLSNSIINSLQKTKVVIQTAGHLWFQISAARSGLPRSRSDSKAGRSARPSRMMSRAESDYLYGK